MAKPKDLAELLQVASDAAEELGWRDYARQLRFHAETVRKFEGPPPVEGLWFRAHDQGNLENVLREQREAHLSEFFRQEGKQEGKETEDRGGPEAAGGCS